MLVIRKIPATMSNTIPSVPVITFVKNKTAMAIAKIILNPRSRFPMFFRQYTGTACQSV